MLINIISPHVAPFLYYFFIKIKQGCDKRNLEPGKKTKKVTRKDYINLYLGPNFDMGRRYSQILVTIFVVLIYSPGMPILYVCAFLFFLICYWVDKILLLRFYRSPPKIDLFIAKLFDVIVLAGLILHYCFAIWMYGNDSILTSTSFDILNRIAEWIKNKIVSEDSAAVEILKRLTFSHNIICFVFLCLVVLLFVNNIFLKGFVNFMCLWRKKTIIEKEVDHNIYEGMYSNILILS